MARSCITTSWGRAAFTLVELLVVIGVIAILVAMLLPALNRARESAMRVTCLTQQRQVYMATMMYVSEQHGWYVPASQMNGQLTGETVGRLNVNGEIGLLRSLKFLPGHENPTSPHRTSHCPTAIIQPGGEYQGYAFRRAGGGITLTTNGITRSYVRWVRYTKNTMGDGAIVPRAIVWCPNYPTPGAYSFAPWTSWKNVHDAKGVNVMFADGSGRWVSNFSGFDYNGGRWSSSTALGIANNTNPAGTNAKLHVDRN